MRTGVDRRVRWTRSQWVWAIALVGASIAVTASAWADTFRLAFKDEEVGYVLVTPFIVGWLIWVRRNRLNYCKPGYQWIGIILILIGWGAWSYGYRHSAPTLWHGGPIVIAIGAFIAAMGVDAVIKLSPAIAAMLFLIPITPTRRQIIAAPLEKYASTWTQIACEFTGLQVVQHGNLLSVNGVNVEVAEACNGMRQVVTFWLVSYVIAFGQPLRWYMRALILLAVPFVAIGSNVIRLVPTVWMYSYGAGDAAQRFHDAAGWAMLILAFGVLYISLAILGWAMVPVRHFQSVTY